MNGSTANVSSATPAPPKKMSDDGVNPSPTTPNPMAPDVALRVEPIHGPTSMGMSTAMKMRTPWNAPT